MKSISRLVLRRGLKPPIPPEPEFFSVAFECVVTGHEFVTPWNGIHYRKESGECATLVDPEHRAPDTRYAFAPLEEVRVFSIDAVGLR